MKILGKKPKKKGKTRVFYDSGCDDVSGGMIIRDTVAGNGIAVFSFFPLLSSEDFTDEYKERITVLQKLLLTYSESDRARHLANDAKYNDTDFGVRKLPFFMRKVQILMEKNEIGDYGVCFFNIIDVQYKCNNKKE